MCMADFLMSIPFAVGELGSSVGSHSTIADVSLNNLYRAYVFIAAIKKISPNVPHKAVGEISIIGTKAAIENII